MSNRQGKTKDLHDTNQAYMKLKCKTKKEIYQGIVIIYSVQKLNYQDNNSGRKI